MDQTTIGKYLLQDNWLSQVMGKSAYTLTVNEEILQMKDLTAAMNAVSPAPYFVSAKVNNDNEVISFLEENGFYLSDVQLCFKRDVVKPGKPSGIKNVRWAEPRDEDAVAGIARNNFFCDRFHRDFNVPKDIADTIKEQWVRNYFRGQRGTHMAVCLKEEKVVGFLQLLKKQEELVIDLVAVDESAQGTGGASRMISFALENIEGIRQAVVKTQQINQASISLYQKNGFKLKEEIVIFHYHGTGE